MRSLVAVIIVVSCLFGSATAVAAEWGAGLHANWGGGVTVDEPSRLGSSGSFGLWVGTWNAGPKENLAGRLVVGVDAVWPGWNAFDTVRTTLVPHLSLAAPIPTAARSRFLISAGVATKLVTGSATLGDADRIGARLGAGLEFPSDTFPVFGWFDARLGYGLETWIAILRTPSEDAELAAGVQLRFSVETR